MENKFNEMCSQIFAEYPSTPQLQSNHTEAIHDLTIDADEYRSGGRSAGDAGEYEDDIIDLTLDDEEHCGVEEGVPCEILDTGGNEYADDDNADVDNVANSFEADIDNDIVQGDGSSNGVVDCGGPQTGMLYSDLNSLFDAYQAYAKRSGFSVAKRTAKKMTTDGELRYARFVCGKFGKRSAQSLSKKTDCQARINAKKLDDGSWVVGKIYTEHNHDLNPCYSVLMPAHRQLTIHQGMQLESIDIAGIKPCKNIKLLEVLAGGPANIPVLRKDCRNFIEKRRRQRLGDGDAEAVRNLFNRLKLKDPNFYSLIDIDNEGRLRNVLWIHPRSRAAYEDFHDAVSFDTTYLVNRHKMPFAAFVGVNHHGHSILLGCALVTSEDLTSFKWLFSNWLVAMGGVAPVGIITDQDESIKGALHEVMPGSIHRYCIWHIMSKLPIKFKGIPNYNKVVCQWKTIVYDSLEIQTFESKWAHFILENQLENNGWLQDLYSERKKWVPIYLHDTFWAGMISTQRSEGMHAYFDDFLHSRMTLIQFMEQYEMAIGSKIQKEFQADFDSKDKIRMCLTVYGWEKQFQDSYTNGMFNRVQDSIERMKYCHFSIDQDSQQGGVEKYKVLETKIYNDSFSKDYTYMVEYKRDGAFFSCNCKNFEFRGILCCHIFETLRNLHVDTVHERYILRRWRKDVFRSCASIFFCGGYPHMTDEFKQYQEMERFFKRTADLAFGNKTMMAHMKKKYEETMEEILGWHKSSSKKTKRVQSSQGRQKKSSQQNGTTIEPTPDQPTIEEVPLRNPQVTKTKGRPTEKRIKSCLERGGRRGRGRYSKVGNRDGGRG